MEALSLGLQIATWQWVVAGVIFLALIGLVVVRQQQRRKAGL